MNLRVVQGDSFERQYRENCEGFVIIFVLSEIIFMLVFLQGFEDLGCFYFNYINNYIFYFVWVFMGKWIKYFIFIKEILYVFFGVVCVYWCFVLMI